MKVFRPLLFMIALMRLADLAGAQARTVVDRFAYTVEVGVSRADTTLGVGFSGGLSWGPRRIRFGFDVEALLTASSDTRYYMDTFSNGQSRCRDSLTGQFASTSKCAPVEVVFGAIGGGALMPIESKPLFIGAGYRLAAKPEPVATVSYSGAFDNWNADWRVNAIVAKEYVSLRWGVAIPTPH
jgi:hypothetical protein